MWFDFITSLGKGCNDTVAFMASRRKCMVKTLIGQKYCIRHLNKRTFSAGQAVPQMSQISFKIVCNCIRELLNVFEDPAQHVHSKRNAEMLTWYGPFCQPTYINTPSLGRGVTREKRYPMTGISMTGETIDTTRLKDSGNKLKGDKQKEQSI